MKHPYSIAPGVDAARGFVVAHLFNAQKPFHPQQGKMTKKSLCLKFTLFVAQWWLDS